MNFFAQQEQAHSLTALDALAPFAKRQLIAGLVRTLNFDGKIATTEAELLRVICLTLHCPPPPLLEAMSEVSPSALHQDSPA